MNRILRLLPLLLLTIALSSRPEARSAAAERPAVLAEPAATQPLATVPFVGCPADGQQGPVAAPKGRSKHLAIPQSAAEHLAWYETGEGGGNLGTLAPRGWHCFGTYGSSGESLYISPAPMSTKGFFGKSPWKGMTGPSVQLTTEYGGTSGRFGVAASIVQLFPHHMKFVTDLIESERQIGGSVPEYRKKSFPSDTLHYNSNELVEFITPADTQGIGTDESWLKPAADPISGMMYLGGITNPNTDVYLVSLFVRFPPALDTLRSVVIQQAEREASQPPS